MDDRKQVLVAGHRGFSAKYPENTLLSFAKALECGVDMIEFDLQLTKDKQIVVIHDESLERTTDGKGIVRDFNLCELKRFDAGGWFSDEFRGLRIPTFEELLYETSGSGGLLYNVEIKEKTFETVDLTMEAIKEAGIEDRSVITCFDADIMGYAHCEYGMRCQGFPSYQMTGFTEGEDGSYSHMYSVGIEKNALSKTMVDFFRERDIVPWAYCIDDEEAVMKTIDLGIYLVTCNDPLPALRILKKNGLHV